MSHSIWTGEVLISQWTEMLQVNFIQWNSRVEKLPPFIQLQFGLQNRFQCEMSLIINNNKNKSIRSVSPAHKVNSKGLQLLSILSYFELHWLLLWLHNNGISCTRSYLKLTMEEGNPNKCLLGGTKYRGQLFIVGKNWWVSYLDAVQDFPLFMNIHIMLGHLNVDEVAQCVRWFFPVQPTAQGT